MSGERPDDSLSSAATAELPAPDSVARLHSDKLKQRIKTRIQRSGGQITFSDYMSAALYEPGLGYYMAGAVKFGARGDFITAPEITSLFGQTLATQILPALETTNGEILELGAGSGQLALDIISALEQVTSLRYSILEPSADLRQRQHQHLQGRLSAELFARVRWLDTLPDGFCGVIVANEVMDALPVERFRIDGDEHSRQIMQLQVDEHFGEAEQPADEALRNAVHQVETDIGFHLPAGYESEICTVLAPWVSSLADCLENGLMLLVDYGYPRKEYYLPERNCGTLSCYYQHRVHDNPYVWPGLQDITAHVDFTAVVEAAISADLELLGYTSQSAFLLNNGLLDLAKTSQQQADNNTDRLGIAKAVKTLTLPGEMGERFQVMALGRGYDLPLAGFQSMELSHRL